MPKIQRGFSPLLFIVVIAIISASIVGGSFLYKNFLMVNKTPLSSLDQPISSPKSKLFSKAEVILKVKVLITSPRPYLADKIKKTVITPMSTVPQNQLIEFKNISFISPWEGSGSAKQIGTGMRFEFGPEKSITILAAESEGLFKEEDLELDNEQFLEKEKQSDGYNIDLQLKALDVTLQELEAARTDEEANKLFRLFLIKSLVAGLSAESISIMQVNNLVAIEGGTSKIKTLNLQDKEGNGYTILITSVSPQDISVILSTLKIK